jgi:hypothetical protein
LNADRAPQLKAVVGLLSIPPSGMINFEHETVFTVTDYWDGPRVGVANFKGEPHYFQCVFDKSADDWTRRFWLHPIDSKTFQLVLEAWQIWERWRDAFHAHQVRDETHPSLPEDRERHRAISLVLESQLRIDPPNDQLAEGNFEIVGPRNQLSSFRKWTVTWLEISNDAIQQALGADSP